MDIPNPTHRNRQQEHEKIQFTPLTTKDMTGPHSLAKD